MNNKIIVPISGMHCRSCELLVQDGLSEIQGVEKSSVDYKKGTAEIEYGQQIPEIKEIENAIRSAGYAVGKDEKTFLSKDPADYRDLAVAAIFLAFLFMVAKKLGLPDIGLGDSMNPSSLGVVFLVGVTAGLSTCMAMVGGLVLAISARHSEKHPEATIAQKFRPHLFFNLGRIGGYAIFGAVLGTIGTAFKFSNSLLGLLTVLVGIVMLMLGIRLLGIFPRFENYVISLPASVSKFFAVKKNVKEYSHQGAMLAGAITFFLPCGFTQAMQLFAISSGSSSQGAMIMGVFALGTAPGLLGIGAITSAVKGIFARRFFKFAGVSVVLMAFLNMASGYNLIGWKTSAVSSQQTAIGVASGKNDPARDSLLENGIQVLRTVYTLKGDIQPSSFTVKAGQPVKFLVDVKENGQGCMSTITVPGLVEDVYQLKAGKNIEMTFTPTKKGAYKITCAMGVPRGTITAE